MTVRNDNLVTWISTVTKKRRKNTVSKVSRSKFLLLNALVAVSGKVRCKKVPLRCHIKGSSWFPPYGHSIPSY
jgi:hypothetical protein